MDNVEEILQPVFIGIALASVLMQTCRYSKAIELFTECLVLLKIHSPNLKKDKPKKLYTLVYHRLFNLYCLVGDYKNAILSGEEALPFFREIYEFVSRAALLERIGDLYQQTGKLLKAKERYQEALTFYSTTLIMFKSLGMPVIKPEEHLNKMLEVTTKFGDMEREGQLLNQLGELASSRFEYSKAEDCFQKALAISKEIGNRKEEGKALRCLGNLYRKTEEYQQSKQHFEKAIAILEEVGEIRQLGTAYNGLGGVCRILREFQQAKVLQKKALEISVKSGDKEGEITHYRFLAGAHTSPGEYDEAEKYYKKALAISKEVGYREDEALTYTDLGNFYRHVNDFEKAEICCRKAREIYKEIGDIECEGSVNSELGYIYHFIGKYEEARKCHKRALAIKKQIGDRRGEGKEYCSLGVVYQSLGDYVQAKKCHGKALSISKETNHLRGQGVDYGNLGTVYGHLGDYDMAYESFKKSLEVNIRTGNKEGIAAAYHHVGSVCLYRGEYVKAEKFNQKALATAKEIGDRRLEASFLCSLANIKEIIGEPEKAKVIYEEALQISKEVGDVEREATMNNNLGNVYKSLGDLSTAKRYLEKSLAIRKRIGSKDREGTVLGNLGALYESLGEYTKAREFCEMALAISRETGDRKGELTMNNNLGTLYFSQNELQKALDCFEKSLRICENMGDDHSKSLSCCHIAGVYIACQDDAKALLYLYDGINSLEKMQVSIGECENYKIGFTDKNAGAYQLMITFLLKMECVDTALSISELARARSLAELMASQYSCQQMPRFDPSRCDDFTNIIRTKSCTCLSFYFVYQNLLCWIIKSSGVEAVTKRGLTADIQPQGASVQDWLESLGNECNRELLHLQGERCEDRSLFLWNENTEVGSSSKVEKESLQTSQANGQGKEEESKKLAVLRELYKLIMTRVLKYLEGSEIIIVPDRSLYRIPFAALIDESGEYLSEKYRIRFIPSLTTLKLIQDSPANYHSQTGALIVGDPDVGLTGLDPLPCAREEVEMIGRLLRVPPLTGKQATKQAVLQKIRSVSLIHIAAHGNADRGDIALAPDQNVKDELKEEDFVLTMSDISKVQLRAKLVVLSCCHSARGQIKAEGVVGIARAFLGSGARSVLVSLWAVDDIATMRFMKQFYGNLVCGKSASQSLHETMKWMRVSPEYSEVRKWAPFMLIGDDVSFDF